MHPPPGRAQNPESKLAGLLESTVTGLGAYVGAALLQVRMGVYI